MNRFFFPIFIILLCQTLFSNEWHDQADKYYNQGQSLKRENKKRDAAVIFRKSAEAEKKSGSVRNERFIRSIGEAAEIFYSLGEYEESFRYYKLMASESSKGTPDDKWTANSGCGKSLIKLGRPDEALNYLESAAAAARATGLNDRLAVSHSLMASLYRSMGDYPRSLENYKLALDYVRKTGVESNVSVIRTNIGILNMIQGRYADALKEFSEALEIDKRGSNYEGVSAVYANMAAAYSEHGYYKEALKSMEASIGADAAGGKPVSAERISAHGKILFAMKDYAAAKDRFEESIELGKKTGNLKGAAGAYLMLGMVHEIGGRKNDAYSNYMEALRINKDLLKNEKSAEMFREIGEVYESRSSYNDAFEFYSLAARRNSALKNSSGLAESYGRIGKILISMRRYQEALNYFDEEKKIIGSEKTFDPVVSAENMRNTGIVLFHLKRYGEAIGNYERAIAGLSKSDDERNKFAKAVADINSRLIPALCEAGRISEAVQISEDDTALRLGLESNGICLLYSERGKMISQTPVKNSASVLFLHSDRDRITRITIVNGRTSYSSVLKESRISRIRSLYGRDIDAYYESLKIDPRRYIPSGGPDEFYNADFQKILSYYTALLSRKYITMRDSETAAAIGRELYQLFFDGIEKDLSGVTGLALKAEGSLSGFPFDTLIASDGAYLAEKHNVRMVFSFEIDSLCGVRDYPAGRKSALFFADPEYTGSPVTVRQIESELDLGKEVKDVISTGKLSAIANVNRAFGFDNLQKPVNSRLETETLNLLSDKSSAHFGNSASASSLNRLSEMGELAGYQIIHFSLYSLIVPEYPELGTLAMSADAAGEGKISRMGIKEISALKIKSDVVTLSDVKYFRGGYSRGEALWVLSSAFIAAGTTADVIPLWDIDDRSRIWFMILFYEGIMKKKMDPWTAFTAARKKFITGQITVPDTGVSKISLQLDDNDIKRYRNPYYWGSFVYYGR